MQPGDDYRSDPDVVLMLRVRGGDAMAFEMLINRYQAAIQRLMMGWVGDTSLAEDLAQEVFLRVYRARQTYEPTAKFRTWVYRIANNVANNAVRDRMRRKEYGVQPQHSQSAVFGLEQMAIDASGAMPHRRFDAGERAAMVQQAMAALPERQRVALILNRFDNLSYQEIADTMQMSVKAVKSLLSRARVGLKALLEPYIENGSLPTRQVPAGRGEIDGEDQDDE